MLYLEKNEFRFEDRGRGREARQMSSSFDDPPSWLPHAARVAAAQLSTAAEAEAEAEAKTAVVDPRTTRVDTRFWCGEVYQKWVDPRTTRVDTRFWCGEVYQKWKTGSLKSADVARLMEDKLARDGYQHRYAATMLNSKNGVCCVVVCQRCSKGFTPNSWSGGRGNPPLQQRRHDSVCRV
jgi:hypothetical protein